MNRYETAEIVKKNGINYLRPTLYPKIPHSDSDIYVITQYGDRLDSLAHQFYGDTTLWWYIAKANNLISLNVPTNLQLRIPGTTQYATGR